MHEFQGNKHRHDFLGKMAAQVDIIANGALLLADQIESNRLSEKTILNYNSRNKR